MKLKLVVLLAMLMLMLTVAAPAWAFPEQAVLNGSEGLTHACLGGGPNIKPFCVE